MIQKHSKNEKCKNNIPLERIYCSNKCFYTSNSRSYQNKWEKGDKIIERVPNNIDPFLCAFISGFTSGEGSFCLNVGKSKTHRTGMQLTPIFVIELKKKDIKILEIIKETMGCGSLINTNRNTVKYLVRRLKDHLEIIIPFYEKYPLLNIKKHDFDYFKLICFKLAKGEGKTKDGINRILSIREFLNDGGTSIRKKIDITNFI